MAHGSGFVYALGKGGKGQPKKREKKENIKYNLICPDCGVKVAREQVSIWDKTILDKGECPYCHKIVKFELIKPRGRPVGSKNKPKEKKNTVVFITSTKKELTLNERVNRVKRMPNPCRYLNFQDIVRITGFTPSFVCSIMKKLKYSLYEQKTSEEMSWRIAVLKAIQDGFTPPDLKQFKQ